MLCSSAERPLNEEDTAQDSKEAQGDGKAAAWKETGPPGRDGEDSLLSFAVCNVSEN